MFMSRVRILAALLAAASVAPALAQDAEPTETKTASQEERIDGAVAFATKLTGMATEALTNEAASEEAKIEAFQQVLADGLALETIGKFMLGESRKSINDDQQARYDAIFPEYITKLYAEQFDQIVGKPINIREAREIGRRDVIVRSEFERNGDAPILVDWRVRQLKSGDRKAIDIIVNGVSIMLVKREEFSSYVAANGVDALLDRLEKEAAA